MIYVYAICEPAIAMPPPRQSGLGGATLRALECAGLAAVYSRHRSLRVQRAVDQILVHERVIESIMARGPVLPLRFGTQFETEQEMEGVLGQRSDELRRVLERLHGRVEMGLRVIPEPGAEAPDPGHPPNGLHYLRSRVQAHQRAIQVESDVHTPLARLVAESVVQDFPQPPAILVAAYLVDKDRIDDFRHGVARVAGGDNSLRVLVTGPWPPYNFAVADQR